MEHPRPIPGTASKSALRCEKIREYADTILQGDDAILLYVQDRLRRNEKRTTEREEFREKWSQRRKRLGRSARVVAQRTKRAKISPVLSMACEGL